MKNAEEITSIAPEIPWRSSRGIRNIVVHEYFGVNMQIMWKAATRNIPDLRAELEKLQTRLKKRDSKAVFDKNCGHPGCFF